MNAPKQGVPSPTPSGEAALLAALPENCLRPPNETAVVSLTEYAMARRYEEGFYTLSVEELQAAVSLAQEFVAWGRAIVK